MHISKRLQTIVDMVKPGCYVCDVGCDHAYTSIALVENGKCPYAVASDVRPGPLAAAQKNIDDAGLTEKISVCLADGVPAGVHELLPEGRRTLVITGMGGMLICRILGEAGERAAAFDEMVLSPQSDIDLVRKKLFDMDFTIDDEEMLIDEGKYYTVIRAEKNSEPGIRRERKACAAESSEPNGGDSHFTEKRAELLYGPVLLGKRHPVLRKYLEKQEGTFEAILENLRRAGRGEDDERYREVNLKREVLREAQRYYEGD